MAVSMPGVFEQLDDVSRRILQQDLPSGSGFGHVTAETGAGLAQVADHAVEIVGHDHEPAPASGLRRSARLAGAACAGGVEEEVQVLAREFCELAGVVFLDREAQPVPIEVNGRVNVACDVSDGCHSAISSAALAPKG